MVPLQASFLTAGVDVQDGMLFWCVAAWSADFTGWVVDYGTWSRHRHRSFTLRKAEPSLQDVFPGAGKEGAILAGLKAPDAELLGPEWPREGGGVARINPGLGRLRLPGGPGA